jgi:hypothetical protein
VNAVSTLEYVPRLSKYEKERIAQMDAVLKHMRHLVTDTGQLINSLQRERDLSRNGGMITSLQKARNRIGSRSRETADKRQPPSKRRLVALAEARDTPGGIESPPSSLNNRRPRASTCG